MRKRWNLLLFFVLFLCSSMQVRAAGIGKDAGQLVGVAEHGAATYGDAAEHSIAAPYTQSTQNPGAAFITSAGMTLANGTAYPLTMVRHALTVDSSGGAAIWKSEFPLGANLALAGNTLTVDVGYPLRFVGGSRFDSLGGLTSSHATTKALVFLDPTVDKIVGNNAPAIGTEKGASFAMGNNAGATSISWSQDGVLLAMSHEGDNSTPDQGDVKIAEFVTDGFTLASNAAWINSAESVADNAFGEATADQRFMVIRFRPIPPNPDDANPKYVVAVGSKGATNNIQVKVFQTSGNAGSKDVAHSANRNVSNSPVAQADTVVAMEWNRKGDKLAVAYIDDSDSSNYKVVVFSADANGNLSSPGTPLNINDASTGVAGATLKEHSIAWAKDDQLMIAFGHSENSGTLRAYRVDFANNAIFRADRTASLIAPNVSAIAYHPTQSVFAAAVDSTGVKLYGYTNDQITLLNEANQTITLAATFNDLQWHPSGKILTIAANGQGTKSYPYDLAAQSLDAANPISNFSLGGSNNVKFVAWDPTSQFFARHKAAATADVQAVSAGAPKGTLTRIILVLNRDITINDRFEIADDCEG